MTTTIIMVALMMCLSLGYVYFMNTRRKRLLGDYTAENQYDRAAGLLPELLAGPLKSIREQMKDTPVDAVTQCMHITNIGKQAASAAITAAKTVAWAAVGVKTKYQTADHACYLVLSGDDIHYLFFEEGDMKEHLVLDKYRLVNARLEKTSGTDKVTRMSSAMGMKSQKIVLDLDGKKMEVLFYNAITRTPEGPLSITSKDVFKTQVNFDIMGRYFKEQLGKKYAHLSS